MRTLAAHASLIVRETAFEQVERAAGGRSEATLELARKLDALPTQRTWRAPSTCRRRAMPAPRPRRPAPAPTAPLRRSFLPRQYRTDSAREGQGRLRLRELPCHAHAVQRPWSTVKNVIDRDPENSLLLRKPTSTAESEGVAGSKATAHGGGQRWTKGRRSTKPS